MTHVRLCTVLLCIVAVTTETAEAQIPDTLPLAWTKVGATPEDYTATSITLSIEVVAPAHNSAAACQQRPRLVR